METIYVVCGETTMCEFKTIRAFHTRQDATYWIDHTGEIDAFDTVWIECINLED